MLLNLIAEIYFLTIASISSRIMLVTFNRNLRLIIILFYSPTNAADEETAVAFYSELSSLIKHTPKHEMKVIAGDLNATIGSYKCKGYCLHEKTDRNGELLLEVIKKCKLMYLYNHLINKNGRLSHTQTEEGSG